MQSRRNSNRGRDFAPPKQPQVKSLLDCSRLSLDSGEKVKLTTQYRVPRDIAAILNDRVYNGDYKTAPSCKAPAQGLRFVDVRQDAEPRRKYVNRYEVDEVLDIIARHQEEQVMVITPVSRFWSSPSDCSWHAPVYPYSHLRTVHWNSIRISSEKFSFSSREWASTATKCSLSINVKGKRPIPSF